MHEPAQPVTPKPYWEHWKELSQTLVVQGKFPHACWDILFILVSQVIPPVSLIDETHPLLLVGMATGVLVCIFLDLEHLNGKNFVLLTSVP